MKTRTVFERCRRFFKLLYIKLFRINDSPQKIALGFGLGVFLGIFPGVGPIATLFMAVFLRVNRASALLACLLTNTWISVVAFLFSLRVGAFVIRADWHNVQAAYQEVVRDFHWANLWQVSVLKVLFPVVVGFFVVAFLFALAAYLIVLAAVTRIKLLARRRKKR